MAAWKCDLQRAEIGPLTSQFAPDDGGVTHGISRMRRGHVGMMMWCNGYGARSGSYER